MIEEVSKAADKVVTAAQNAQKRACPLSPGIRLNSRFLSVIEFGS